MTIFNDVHDDATVKLTYCYRGIGISSSGEKVGLG